MLRWYRKEYQVISTNFKDGNPKSEAEQCPAVKTRGVKQQANNAALKYSEHNSLHTASFNCMLCSLNQYQSTNKWLMISETEHRDQPETTLSLSCNTFETAYIHHQLRSMHYINTQTVQVWCRPNFCISVWLLQSETLIQAWCFLSIWWPVYMLVRVFVVPDSFVVVDGCLKSVGRKSLTCTLSTSRQETDSSTYAVQGSKWGTWKPEKHIWQTLGMNMPPSWNMLFIQFFQIHYCSPTTTLSPDFWCKNMPGYHIHNIPVTLSTCLLTYVCMGRLPNKAQQQNAAVLLWGLGRFLVLSVHFQVCKLVWFYEWSANNCSSSNIHVRQSA